MCENHRKQRHLGNYFLQTFTLQLKREREKFRDIKLFAPGCTVRK